MRWTVYDYSQHEIVKLNDLNPDNKLDFTDLFILTWFKNFKAKTDEINTNPQNHPNKKGMWRKLIDGNVYYWVNYSAIIEEYPMMGVSSIKSISRRFEKYVAIGIMQKKVYHNGKKGTVAFFNTTDTFSKLERDYESEEQKDNPHETVIKDKNVQCDEKESVIKDKNVRCNSSLTEDKNVFCNEEKNLTEDKNVLCNLVTEDKNVRCFKVNSNTNLKNSTTISNFSPEARNIPVKTLEEAEYFESIKNLFGYNPGFNPDPFPELCEKMHKCEIPLKFITDYLEWVFSVLKPNCKNQSNFISYFYKSFTKEYYLSKFWFSKQQELKISEQKEARMILCPVCGKRHDSRDIECPECSLHKDYLNNPDYIKKEKAEYNLKIYYPEVFEKYNLEIKKLFDEYPLFQRSLDSKLNEEFLQNMKKLEDKYLKIA